MNVTDMFTTFIIGLQSFCKTCKGSRVVRGPKTVKLDIMPGNFKLLRMDLNCTP